MVFINFLCEGGHFDKNIYMRSLENFPQNHSICQKSSRGKDTFIKVSENIFFYSENNEHILGAIFVGNKLEYLVGSKQQIKPNGKPFVSYFEMLLKLSYLVSPLSQVMNYQYSFLEVP